MSDTGKVLVTATSDTSLAGRPAAAHAAAIRARTPARFSRSSSLRSSSSSPESAESPEPTESAASPGT